MLKKSDKALSENHSKIVKCIFKGMTIAQIAKEMYCSQSCVSYHISSLYAKYKAKTRSEFILSVFGEIMDKYKSLIDLKNSKIIYLNKQNINIKKILEGLIINQENKEAFEYWVLQAQKYI
ncbi:MAG: helix-turn-helix transcriptional regulator [Candidatus Gastranaerophilales bacterium]|nr:helix-turn-helix transcriptional regulator [Candidatus Gastranaerophilales bacterium]